MSSKFLPIDTITQTRWYVTNSLAILPEEIRKCVKTKDISFLYRLRFSRITTGRSWSKTVAESVASNNILTNSFLGMEWNEGKHYWTHPKWQFQTWVSSAFEAIKRIFWQKSAENEDFYFHFDVTHCMQFWNSSNFPIEYIKQRLDCQLQSIDFMY